MCTTGNNEYLALRKIEENIKQGIEILGNSGTIASNFFFF
jgi:hypothetical protein